MKKHRPHDWYNIAILFFLAVSALFWLSLDLKKAPMASEGGTDLRWEPSNAENP